MNQFLLLFKPYNVFEYEMSLFGFTHLISLLILAIIIIGMFIFWTMASSMILRIGFFAFMSYTITAFLHNKTYN